MVRLFNLIIQFGNMKINTTNSYSLFLNCTTQCCRLGCSNQYVISPHPNSFFTIIMKLLSNIQLTARKAYIFQYIPTFQDLRLCASGVITSQYEASIPWGSSQVILWYHCVQMKSSQVPSKYMERLYFHRKGVLCLFFYFLLIFSLLT